MRIFAILMHFSFANDVHLKHDDQDASASGSPAYMQCSSGIKINVWRHARCVVTYKTTKIYKKSFIGKVSLQVHSSFFATLSCIKRKHLPIKYNVHIDIHFVSNVEGWSWVDRYIDRKTFYSIFFSLRVDIDNKLDQRLQKIIEVKNPKLIGGCSIGERKENCEALKETAIRSKKCRLADKMHFVLVSA